MDTLCARSPFGFVIAEQLGQSSPHLILREDEWFYEALKEARRGVGRTHPNPPVGCVIVKNDRVIARGFTAPAGDCHAEINALREAGLDAQGAVLYSTLEPCNHYGRTPPCTEAIIKAGIERVVIGVKDPNPIVDGSGIRALMQAGIAVKLRAEDALTEQARSLMLPFAKNIRHGLPWVVCKVATSLDGRIAAAQGVRTSISHSQAWELVHRLRNCVDAVAVGSNTVEIDNPQLTVRGLTSGNIKNPIRIVFDGALKTHTDRAVYQTNQGVTYVIHTSLAMSQRINEFDRAAIKRIEVESEHGHLSLRQALMALARMGIMSVLVECGAKLLTQFLAEKLFDELWWVVSPAVFGAKGPNAIDDPIASSDLPQIEWMDPISLGRDTLYLGQRQD